MPLDSKKSYIGIDVSKAKLDVFCLEAQKHMQFDNTAQGISRLINKLKLFANSSVVMEATGGYEKLVAQSLHLAQIDVCISNPRQIRDFARGLGILAKTDKIDAKVIALFGQTVCPTPNVSTKAHQAILADYTIRRAQLINMRTMERNRLDKTSSDVQGMINTVVTLLEEQLAMIDAAIEEHINNQDELKHKRDLLITMKGVGKTSAQQLLAALPELGTLNSKQVAALAGLAPFNRDSGQMQGKRMIRGGRHAIRQSLYMATLVAVRYNVQFQTVYQRLCAAGKAKKVAIVACMRKLLIVLNAMIREQKPWILAKS